MERARQKDRRQYKRYYVKNRIFAVVRSADHKLNRINDMSKGEIAFAVIKSNPTKMGEIKEISQNGLSFHYIQNESDGSQFPDLSQFKEMDILFVDENFHLRRIPFKTIEDSAVDLNGPFSTLAMKRLTVQFNGLTIKQKRKLRHVIKNFTTGEVPFKISKQAWGSRP